jgi:hypothetical protein
VIALESERIKKEVATTAPLKTVKRGTNLSTRMAHHRVLLVLLSQRAATPAFVRRKEVRASNQKLEAPKTQLLDCLPLETR